MEPQTQRRITRKLGIIAPISVFLLLVYGSWSFAYYVCWGEVRKHHSATTANGLVAGEVLLAAMVYIIWIQMLIVGPGRQPKLSLYRLIEDPEVKEDGYRTIDPPEVFSCDIQGYPLWCSTCESIKAERAHHSSNTGHCVPRLDHYCTWVYCLIGKRNYRLFIQYCFWFWMFFMYVLVTTAVYTSGMIEHNDNTLNPNVIVLYILCGMWFLILYAMVGQYFYYIGKNEAAIDDLELRRNKKEGTLVDKYYSVTHENVRYILHVNPFNQRVFDKGIVKNWTEIMGSNPLWWFIPFGSTVTAPPFESQANSYEKILGEYTERPSEKWLAHIHERIAAGDFVKKESLPA